MPRKRSDGVPEKRTTPRVPKAGKPPSKEEDLLVPDTKAPFPFVGIGDSAGELEAFEQFFTHTPPDTRMAFVLIQYLDPQHKSILSEPVRRYTKKTVHEVEDGMLVEPEWFLFLGSSETIGEFSDYFSVLDSKWKLYKRKDANLAQRHVPDIHTPTATDRRVDAQSAIHGAPVRGTNYREAAEKIIVESYGPTGVRSCRASTRNWRLPRHGRV
jgi:hypothetical protein